MTNAVQSRPDVQPSLRQPNWIVLSLLCLIILLATGLRFYELGGDSLWGDEIIEASRAQWDLAEVLSEHPDLRLYLTHFSMLVSKDEFFVRLPYALAGILSVAMGYVVGKTLFDVKTGVINAFLLTISSFHIHYSQEARSYAFTFFLVQVTLYCLYRALQDNKLKYWAGFAVLTALSLNNHLTTGSVFASQVAWAILVLLWQRAFGPTEQLSGQALKHIQSNSKHPRLSRLRSSRVAMLALSSILAGMIYLPFAIYWLSLGTDVGVGVVGLDTAIYNRPIMRLTVPYFTGLLDGFGAGGGIALYFFVGAFVAGLVACAVQQQWRQGLIALIWVVLPFVIAPYVSFDRSISFRHLSFILPMYLLLIARGIAGISELVARLAGRLIPQRGPLWSWGFSLILAVGVFGGVSVSPVRQYYESEKEDWRGTAAFLREHAESGDLIFQTYATFTRHIPYYLDSYLVDGNVRFISLDEVEQVSNDDLPADVWWVVYQHASAPQEISTEVTELLEVIKSDFELTYFYPAIVIAQRKTPIADLDDFSQEATRMILVQALFDDFPNRLDSYISGTKRAYLLSEWSPDPYQKCSHGSYGPIRYIEQAGEQLKRGQAQASRVAVFEALKLHAALYQEAGKLDSGSGQTLLVLGDMALAADDLECASAFYSRASSVPTLDDTRRVESGIRLVEAYENLRDLDNACAVLHQVEQWTEESDVSVAALRERLVCQE
jgi:mannosyltransferase